MARDDWVEWLQPWNWTVHMQNGTGAAADRNLTQVVCDSAKAMQAAFAIDNFVSLGEAALELFVFWLCCICAWNVAMSEVKSMRRSLVAGLVTGGLYLVSNFATSIMWDLKPGYSHIPRGFVGLLLCARPSFLGFLSLFSIAGRGRVARSIPSDGEALRRQRERSWLNRTRVKAWRRSFGTFLRKFERGEGRNRPVTDEDLADGKETAKQLLAGFALTISVSELVIQVSSVYSIFKTATVGGSRGFFSRYALLPFYEGYSASLMYDGALLHCVFLFPSTLGLVLIAWSHAKETQYREWRLYLDINDRRARKLRTYHENRPVGPPLTDDERAEARYMFQEQRAFELALLRRQRPGFWKRRWIRLKALFIIPGPEPITPPPPPPAPEESSFFHIIRVKLTLVVMRPLDRLIREANAPPPEPTDPEATRYAATTGASEAGSTNTAGDDSRRPTRNPLIRRVRRLAGRALSAVPFIRTRITRSFNRANEEDTRRRTERERQERGPSHERFRELDALHLENLRADEEKRRKRPSSRSPAFLATVFFVSMNYVSQWLFWAGYVETVGER